MRQGFSGVIEVLGLSDDHLFVAFGRASFPVGTTPITINLGELALLEEENFHLVEVEEDANVLLFDSKPGENVTSPQKLFRDDGLKELFDSLNSGLRLLGKDLSHIHVSTLWISGNLFIGWNFHGSHLIKNPLRKFGVVILPDRIVFHVLSLN